MKQSGTQQGPHSCLSNYTDLHSIRITEGRDFSETARESKGRVRTIINDPVRNGDRATLFKSRYISSRLFLVMTGLKRILIRPHLRNVLVKNINKTSGWFSRVLKTLHC